MKLTAKQIKQVTFTIQDKGYSPKEVDDFLDKVVADYEYEEIKLNILIDDILYESTPKIKISNSFDGEIMPLTVEYDGTVADWIRIENKGIFKEVPCINCRDGQYIQKL